MFEFVQKYDVLILGFLNDLGTPAFDPFWLFITKIYVWVPCFALLFFFAFKRFTKKQTLTILVIGALMLGFVLGLTEIIKNLAVRIRPINNPLLDGIFREVIYPSNYSFYSGHAATSVALATYFISILKREFKAVYILLLWAILFPFSRLYFAVHYPSDIVTGAVIGFVVAKLFLLLANKRLR